MLFRGICYIIFDMSIMIQKIKRVKGGGKDLRRKMGKGLPYDYYRKSIRYFVSRLGELKVILKTK